VLILVCRIYAKTLPETTYGQKFRHNEKKAAVFFSPGPLPA